MALAYVPILKGNRGELQAIDNLDAQTSRNLRPLFEIGRVTDAIRQRQYFKNSSTPTITYLDRVIDGIGRSWSSRIAFVDGYQWPANAQVETGEHAIAYMIRALRERNVSVIPVIGYDRWENSTYKMGMKSIPPRSDGQYCLRLDSSAIEDEAEPEHFQSIVSDIIDELNIEPSKCSILIDFGDVSSAAMSVERLVAKCTSIIQQLRTYHFAQYIIAGCSLPKSIDLAVSTRDSVGVLLRKEMLAWQTVRTSFPTLRIISGDYGVRGPTTSEAPSPYTNGKIRHTIGMQILIARGHALSDDHSNIQMQALSHLVVRSPHYLGGTFSWGDEQILLCSQRGAFGSPTTWIAIDTNHHLTFVVQEVLEIERRVPATNSLTRV